MTNVSRYGGVLAAADWWTQLDWVRRIHCCTGGRFGLVSLRARYLALHLSDMHPGAEPGREGPSSSTNALPVPSLRRIASASARVIRTLPDAPGRPPLRLMRSACVPQRRPVTIARIGNRAVE